MTEGGHSPGVLLVRFHPSSGAAGGHGRTNLQPTDSTAPSAPNREWQAPRSPTGRDQFGQRQHSPAVARRAVGV
jgi:hypothetical protein